MGDITIVSGKHKCKFKLRCVRNRHGSAQAAFRAWTSGSLWCATPLVLGDGQQIHVYGIYLGNWSFVYVDFTDKWITVIKLIPYRQ